MKFPGRSENSAAGAHFYFPYRSPTIFRDGSCPCSRKVRSGGCSSPRPDNGKPSSAPFPGRGTSGSLHPEAKDLRFLSPGPAGERGTDSFLRRMLQTLEEGRAAKRVMNGFFSRERPCLPPTAIRSFWPVRGGIGQPFPGNGPYDRLPSMTREFFPFPFLQGPFCPPVVFSGRDSLIPNPLYEFPPRFNIGETPARAIRRFQELLFRQEESTRLQGSLRKSPSPAIYVVQHGRFRYINPNAASYGRLQPGGNDRDGLG
jgi:hypothetical protein